MPGSLIISFDCEGKWGMADHLTSEHHRLLTDRNLEQVYRDLTGLLDRYRAPATFAFVMAFLLDARERPDFADMLRPANSEDCWMRQVATAQARHPEGWFQPGALDLVAKSGLHEIGCHGFCHRSLADGELSRKDAERDLDAAQEVARRKHLQLETMIFPRNRVGNLAALKQRGYRGYRARKPAKWRRVPASLANLLEELNTGSSAEPKMQARKDELVVIPHGHFFNWRHGARMFVPPAVTVRRWANMIDRAVVSEQVAHLWLHPHNFITGPATWGPFESVLQHACKLRDAGRLEIVTQADYCAALPRAQ